MRPGSSTTGWARVRGQSRTAPSRSRATSSSRLGTRAELEARFGPSERLDAILLPALVNAHLHLELSHLAGKVPGGDGLPAWIGRFVRARAETPEAGGRPRDGAACRPAAPLRRGGSRRRDQHARLARPPRAARDRRHALPRGLRRDPGADRRGARAARAPPARRPAPRPPGLRVVTEPARRLLDPPRDAGAPPRRRPVVRPPRRGSGGARPPGARRGSLRRGPRRARRGSPATSPAPDRPWRSPPRRSTSATSPSTASTSTARTWRSSRAPARRSRSAPAPTRTSAGRIPNLPALLAAGIPLALGTDSLASCPSLSPLAEVAALRRAFPEVPADRARRAPLERPGGRRAVGRPAHASGFAPGVVAAPLDGASVDDPFEFLAGAFGERELRSRKSAPQPSPPVGERGRAPPRWGR